MIKNIIIITLIMIIIVIGKPVSVLAVVPSSTNFQIRDYGFGAGGVSSASAGVNGNYTLFGILGETDVASISSSNFRLGNGLVFAQNAYVPTITLTNVSTNYDRLKFVLGPGTNPSDTKYAIAISTDNFGTNIRYIKADNTIGTTLTGADYQSYTTWGGASGAYVTGLANNTTYYVKAKAKEGNFTDSPYGPPATATTSEPSLTFSVDADAITFNNLNTGNSYTDSSKSTILTTSTNAYNGYVVNARETGSLTKSGGTETITDYTSPNSGPTSWSGLGFGYTTNDSDLTGGTANRFTSGGPNYAGFTSASPGDPVADHAGPVLSPVVSEQFTVSYRITVNGSQAAGVYRTTVLYISVPEY